MSEAVQAFEADVSRVLDLVINSLYKEREIFLRELISNASDACDKLRFESLSRPELLGDDTELKIKLVADPGQSLLTVSDNGVGMGRDELVDNLGTIARSGTARFVERMSGDAARDTKLIGQFGVGFYSAFMVADKVVVRSRKADESTGWLWASDGRSGFTTTEAPEPGPRGTSITLHLKPDAKSLLDGWKIREIVRTYSDHIGLPIILESRPAPGETKTNLGEPQQINRASALWTRPRSEITDEQYKEFYHHAAHAFDDPFARVHFTAEGMLSYTALLFVPTQRPFDLFDAKRRHGVKLYVRRVLITDDLEELLPRWLRFVSGVVDSEDLQLNVSRETLQHGPVVAKMRKAATKRLVEELAARSGDEQYPEWWAEFGQVVKEGIYEDAENRKKLLEIARFRSTGVEGWTRLSEYVARMKPGQEGILYISGESHKALRTSPQLEEARAKGVEVLLLDDPVDEFWLPEAKDFDGKPFRSLTKGEVDLSTVEGGEVRTEAPVAEADLQRLIARLKVTLGESIGDVRPSKRLRDSAVCLVAAEASMDMRLERFLKQHSQVAELSKRVMEINPQHELVRRMGVMAADESRAVELDELAHLLLDQGRIIEGETIPDPGAFSRRMSSFLARSIAG